MRILGRQTDTSCTGSLAFAQCSDGFLVIVSGSERLAPQFLIGYDPLHPQRNLVLYPQQFRCLLRRLSRLETQCVPAIEGLLQATGIIAELSGTL